MSATARKISEDIYAETLNAHPSYKKFKQAFDELQTIGLHTISIKELVALMNHGKIKIYNKNRGTVGLIEKHIEKIVDNFDVDSLGMIPLVKEGKQLFTVDGSHRMNALCRLAVKGLLEPFWNEEIPVKVLGKGSKLTSYMNINSGIKHSKLNTLSNSELPYGKMIAQIIDLAQSKTGIKTPLPTKMYNHVATLIFAVNNNLLLKEEYMHNWSWENVSLQNSSLARKDIERPSPLIKDLSIHGCANLVDGVCIVLEYLDKLAEHKKQMDKDLKHTIYDSKTRSATIKSAFKSCLISQTIIGYLLCAGSRDLYKLKHADEFFMEIFQKSEKIENKIDTKLGISNKAKVSKYLDSIIFGKALKKDDLRYWPKQ